MADPPDPTTEPPVSERSYRSLSTRGPVILFVIVLRLLPKERPGKDAGKAWRVPVAVCVGLRLWHFSGNEEKILRLAEA